MFFVLTCDRGCITDVLLCFGQNCAKNIILFFSQFLAHTLANALVKLRRNLSNKFQQGELTITFFGNCTCSVRQFQNLKNVSLTFCNFQVSSFNPLPPKLFWYSNFLDHYCWASSDVKTFCRSLLSSKKL